MRRSDSSYVVAAHDWPAVGHKNDLTAEQLEDVLDDFEEHYGTALRSLSKTPLTASSGDPDESPHG